MINVVLSPDQSSCCDILPKTQAGTQIWLVKKCKKLKQRENALNKEKYSLFFFKSYICLNISISENNVCLDWINLKKKPLSIYRDEAVPSQVPSLFRTRSTSSKKQVYFFRFTCIFIKWWTMHFCWILLGKNTYTMINMSLFFLCLTYLTKLQS